MTDKEQIIIDGCNVLKCRYYQYKTLKDCEMRYPESGDCEIGLLNYLFNGNLDMEKLCIDNPNCSFKQLARSEARIKELGEKLNAQFAEMEEKLTAEEMKNFELKEENQKLEMQLCNDCGERDDYNIPCKMIRDLDYGLQKEIEENDRYRKALEEIEKYCNNVLSFTAVRTTESDILDIINKAKGE